jgi:ATP-dependent helicase/nuclease subunit B
VECVVAEHNGAITFPFAGGEFSLSCRADRIDLMADGSARIVDYKTGGVPSTKEVDIGLAPQLTLQAAILARGGFTGVNPRHTGQLWYVKLSGGTPAGEVEPLTNLSRPVRDLAEAHLAALQKLLGRYAGVEQPYYPRTIMKKEDDPSDYDHLSRFQEWTLSGGGA